MQVLFVGCASLTASSLQFSFIIEWMNGFEFFLKGRDPICRR